MLLILATATMNKFKTLLSMRNLLRHYLGPMGTHLMSESFSVCVITPYMDVTRCS